MELVYDYEGTKILADRSTNEVVINLVPNFNYGIHYNKKYHSEFATHIQEFDMSYEKLKTEIQKSNDLNEKLRQLNSLSFLYPVSIVEKNRASILEERKKIFRSIVDILIEGYQLCNSTYHLLSTITQKYNYNNKLKEILYMVNFFNKFHNGLDEENSVVLSEKPFFGSILDFTFN